jgi:hypothetical protein
MNSILNFPQVKLISLERRKKETRLETMNESFHCPSLGSLHEDGCLRLKKGYDSIAISFTRLNERISTQGKTVDSIQQVGMSCKKSTDLGWMS